MLSTSVSLQASATTGTAEMALRRPLKKSIRWWLRILATDGLLQLTLPLVVIPHIFPTSLRPFGLQCPTSPLLPPRKVPLEDLIYTSCTDPIPQPAAARTPRLHQPSAVTHLFYAYVRKATNTEFNVIVLGRDLILYWVTVDCDDITADVIIADPSTDSADVTAADPSCSASLVHRTLQTSSVHYLYFASDQISSSFNLPYFTYLYIQTSPAFSVPDFPFH
ncbi:receptor-like protein 12 [Dorcoceras hygrometricum]|nr:receptor-like protein 12 [Dorcoceras hygrometricum]